MIFVTVGTQGHFDRMVRTVDEWAGKHGRTDVFAQTGPSDASYRHIRVEQFIDPAKFRECVESASLVIAHAGMGSIITALELGKANHCHAPPSEHGRTAKRSSDGHRKTVRPTGTYRSCVRRK